MKEQPWAAYSRFLKNALGDLLDSELDDVQDFFAADAIFEFPYAPEGYPGQLAGAEAIQAHLEQLPAQIVIDRIGEPTIHRTQAVVVLEYEVSGRAVASGRPYDQRYINVITTRNGRIAHFRDYWNPLVVLQALQS